MDDPTPGQQPVRRAAPTTTEGDDVRAADQVTPVGVAVGFGPRRYSWLPLAGAFTLAAVPVLAILGARFL